MAQDEGKDGNKKRNLYLEESVIKKIWLCSQTKYSVCINIQKFSIKKQK